MKVQYPALIVLFVLAVFGIEVVMPFFVGVIFSHIYFGWFTFIVSLLGWALLRHPLRDRVNGRASAVHWCGFEISSVIGLGGALSFGTGSLWFGGELEFYYCLPILCAALGLVGKGLYEGPVYGWESWPYFRPGPENPYEILKK